MTYVEPPDHTAGRVTEIDFRALIAAGEGPHLDLKLECHAFHGDGAATAELVKDLCALANGSPAEPRRPGVLLVGVGNDRMTFRSVRNAKLADDPVQDLVRTSLYPPPDVRLLEVTYEVAGEEQPYTLKAIAVAARPGTVVRIRRDLTGGTKGGLIHRMNEVWVRRGSTNELASPEDVVRLHDRDDPGAPLRAPALAVVAQSDPHGTPAAGVSVTLPVLPPLSSDERARRIATLIREHRPIDMAMPLPMFGGQSYEQCCAVEEIDRYEAEMARYPGECEQYVDAAHAYEERAVRQAFLYMEVVNTGTAAATHVMLTTAAPTHVDIARARIGDDTVVNLARPLPPTAPTPPRPDTRVPLPRRRPLVEPEVSRGARAPARAQPATVRGPTTIPGRDEGSGSRLRYEFARVAHGDAVALDPIVLRFEDMVGDDFKLEFTIHADELSEPVHCHVDVRVTVAPANAAGAA